MARGHGERIKEVEEAIIRLDESLAQHNQRLVDVEEDLKECREALPDIQGALGGLMTLQTEVENIKTQDTLSAVEALKEEMAEIRAQLKLLTRAIGNVPQGGAHDGGHRVKVPSRKSYEGARDMKEVENFLFDMEQYFKAVKASEEDKVSMATMYLAGDAKLWWRTKYMEIEEGRLTIDTWEQLKRELRCQFLPENTAYNARLKLKSIRHTSSIREYVRQFTSALLDVRDMSEYDKW